MRSDRPSFTARWVATYRARLHDRRPATPNSRADLERALYRSFGRMPGLGWMPPTGMAQRTAFVDDEVVAAIDAGTEQIVLVGAGYDGRPLRFATPGLRWFEVDHPATQPDKLRRLAAAGAPADVAAFLAVDLLSDDLAAALGSAGHDPARPTLFVCEGLFTYLPNPVGARLCETLRQLAGPGSRLVANFLVAGSPRAGLLRVVDRTLSALGEQRQGIYRVGDPDTMLAANRWTVARRDDTKPNPLAGGSHLELLAAEPA